jgi:Holliday junction resolvase RusA-like endonuclease
MADKTKLAPQISRISLIVPGEPVAKPRQTQRDKWKPTESVQRFRTYADRLKWVTRQHMKSQAPLGGAVELSAVFYLPIPAGWPVAQQRKAERGEWLHMQKPDLKNLIAGLEDALNGIAWVDDQQICSYGRCLKVWDDGKGPRTAVLAYVIGQNADANRARLQRAGQLVDGLT